MVKKIKTAIIGHGHLGKWHAQKVSNHPNSELTAIIDKKVENLKEREELEKLYPSVTITSELSNVIHLIDAAIVVTPTSTHFEVVKELLLAKKHVFCEKPMTQTYEEGKKIKDLLEGIDIVFQVGHSERFHQLWQEMEIIRPFLKTPGVINMRREAAFKGRAADVDVVSDLMIHDLDILEMLFKKEINLIDVVGIKSVTTNWDHVEALFEIKEGPKAFITSSRIQLEEKRSIEIINEWGTLVIDLLKGQIEYINGDQRKVLQFEKKDHLKEEQDCFYKSILNKTPPKVSIQDGLNAVALVQIVKDRLLENENNGIIGNKKDLGLDL